MAEHALNESERYTVALLKRIKASNRNLEQRMRAEGMEIDYSPEDDYLRVTIGRLRSCESVPQDDAMGSVFLVEPETAEIAAVEVPFFRERLRRVSPSGDFWRLIASLIERGHNYVYIPPTAEAEATERALGNLVSA
jgi:hypothetical protein